MSAFGMRETPDYQQITHTEQGRTLLPHALISIKVDDSRAKLTRSSSGEGLDRDEVVMRESRMGSRSGLYKIWNPSRNPAMVID
jgi:hypothetical protein